jgi:serine/threonine protein kinase
MRVLMPLLEGLQAVHQAGFLHRDIKPSNIFIRDNGSPLLIDFGSARLAISGATRTLTSVLTPGFAPLEQYSKEGNEGPWTDVYSFAAVMYRAVTGDNPPDVVTRLKDDPVIQALIAARERFSMGFLHAVNRGMETDEKKRPQTVPEWRAMFTGEAFIAPGPLALENTSAVAGVSDVVKDAPTQRLRKAIEPAAGSKQPSMTQLTWFAAGALALFLVVGGAHLFDKSRSSPTAGSAGVTGPGKDKPAKLTPREFYVVDRDRSGYLTPDEIKGDALLEQNFTRIDTNHDGRISLEEFTGFPP